MSDSELQAAANKRFFVVGYDVPAPIYGAVWDSDGKETEDYLQDALCKTAIENAPCKLVSTFFMDARSAPIGKRLMAIWECGEESKS